MGLLGGLSPESTIKYYQWLNHGVRQRLGGQHSAKILISAVDFGEFLTLKQQDNWQRQADILVSEAVSLEQAGAEFLVLATNTMHKVADQLKAAINIPFLHLADATADSIIRKNISSVGLIGTRFTMEMDFYKKRLEAKAIGTLIPEKSDREIIGSIIYDELCNGIIRQESKSEFLRIISHLESEGAQGVILGCTEITMLISQPDHEIPFFDTTKIHVEAALDEMFS